jgi:hypothetical protein
MTEPAHDALFAIGVNGEIRGYRVMDLRKEYAPLVKELGWRAVADHPHLAGRPWRLAIHSQDMAGPEPRLVLEALAQDAGEAATGSLARLPVAVDNFSWIGARMARKLEIEGKYACYVRVLAPHDPLVKRWANRQDDDADIEMIDDPADQPLLLPADFRTDPPPPCRVIDPAPSWLHCVVARGPFEQFIRAAAAERSTERGWAGLGHVHARPEGCYVVIDQDLVELPVAEAARDHLVTRGRDFLALQQRAGGSLVAYLHLHPPMVAGKAIAPSPSGPDATLAWDFDRSCVIPACLPIALFGANVERPRGFVAAHGYEKGLLDRIQLEVTTL